MPRLLVIDDDRAILALVERSLGPVAEVTTAASASEGLRQLRSSSFDVVLLDIQLPEQNGLATYCEIREHDRRIPVIFMTIEASSATAIEAMQLGAFDYVAKPLSVEPLRELITKAITQREISSVPVAIEAEEAGETESDEPFLGRSPVMLEVFKAIGKVSQQDVPVLIRGESGTGKELVARALFQYSHRSDKSFLAVNCAALPENLLESELFGHEKGAFTGADSRRIGKLEQCDGGTLFLDEIGDMSASLQAKVLRVLQEQRFERVGGNRQLTTDTRILAATNRPLEEMVQQGSFREDLMYRLNGVTINLPPLRERLSDIPALLQYFMAQAKREFNKPDLEGLSPEALDLLMAYSWPGNVRQLRAVIRRSVLDTVMPVITPDELPEEIRTAPQTKSASPPGACTPSMVSSSRDQSDESNGIELPRLVAGLLEQQAKNLYGTAIEYTERYVITEVLQATGGNQSRAAEILGITRGKLRDRIANYNIKLKSQVEIESKD